jgi:hypothetical protein
MNIKGYSNSILVIFLILNVFFCNAQDIIIKKKGKDIKAKVLEITQTIIKYKRFDNLNGPIYIIPKIDVYTIRYKNGRTISFDGNSTKTVNRKIPTDLLEEIAGNSNTKKEITEGKKNNPIEENLIEYNQENKIDKLPIFAEKKTEQAPILTNEYLKYNNKKTVWKISAILATGVGAFSIIQSNNLYKDYKIATSQANSIHSQIESLNIIYPIAFALAGFSAIKFFDLQSKQNKAVKFKVVPDKNAISGIRLGINYSF